MAVDKAKLFVLRKGRKRILLGELVSRPRSQDKFKKCDTHLAMVASNREDSVDAPSM
jgi:hypothetical protein